MSETNAPRSIAEPEKLEKRVFLNGEEAAWLADKIVTGSPDYCNDAARFLRKYSDLEQQLAAANARNEELEKVIHACGYHPAWDMKTAHMKTPALDSIKSELASRVGHITITREMICVLLSEIQHAKSWGYQLLQRELYSEMAKSRAQYLVIEELEERCAMLETAADLAIQAFTKTAKEYKAGELVGGSVEVSDLRVEAWKGLCACFKIPESNWLARHDNEVLERAAMVCETVDDSFTEHPEMALTCAENIRALKTPCYTAKP